MVNELKKAHMSTGFVQGGTRLVSSGWVLRGEVSQINIWDKDSGAAAVADSSVRFRCCVHR